MITYSIWLLPPDPVMELLTRRVARVAADSRGACPDFQPHMTLLGAFELANQDEALAVLARLRGSGPVECRFESTNVVSGVESTGTIPWNQAALTTPTVSRPGLPNTRYRFHRLHNSPSPSHSADGISTASRTPRTPLRARCGQGCHRELGRADWAAAHLPRM